jgi:hypothetical protein
VSSEVTNAGVFMTDKVKFANLEIEIQSAPKEVTFRFRGDVDENFRQEEVPRIARDRILFELAEINNFNSCGIREWIYLMKDMSKQGQIVFRNCSITMIDQINMVPDSLGNGEIESFYAPYYCSCKGEVIKLIEVKKHMNDLVNKQAPRFKCDDCGKTMEFDALEESYFLFCEGIIQAAS